MNKKSPGPFKRHASKSFANNSIHTPLIGVALSALALTQVPISIKATLDLVCIAKLNNEKISQNDWCWQLK
tara:strand:- start:139 stop:351 length:213 start_codon:yes stop_codon:yes gene_type:complete